MFRWKFFVRSMLVALVVLGIFCPTIRIYAQEEYVYLGGYPAGFILNMDGVQVIGLSEVVSESGTGSPAKEAELHSGDRIISIDDIKIESSADIDYVCRRYKEGKMLVQYVRNGEKRQTWIVPKKDLSTGFYRLGLLVRDSVSGIGTVTYVTENGGFGALGHPVYEDVGNIMRISGGTCYKCSVIGVNRGERGAPGELRGLILKDLPIGSIKYNSEGGLFGRLDESAFSERGMRVPVADVSEVRMGKASIYATVDGSSPKEYRVSIVKVDKNNKDNKNFVVKITDKALLEKTSGIVQGMSGSPIVQNGKIIGAITHVFINDPARGFGIAIKNMMESA